MVIGLENAMLVYERDEVLAILQKAVISDLKRLNNNVAVDAPLIVKRIYPMSESVIVETTIRLLQDPEQQIADGHLLTVRFNI